MDRYMIHLNNAGYLPSDSRKVVYKARDLVSDMTATVRVARIATKFVELDVTVAATDLDNLIEHLLPIGSVDNVRHVVEEEIEKEQGIKDGIYYFNNERFWESHESFEGVWKRCFGREKELVQGIILVAVAFAHAQKDEQAIGLGVLGRATDKLGNSPAMYHGIDIDRIRDKTRNMQQSNNLTIFEI